MCDFLKVYSGQRGTLYNFRVGFENGDTGTYSSTSQDNPKFKVGEEYEYEITEKEYQGQAFYIIKPVYQQSGYKSGSNSNANFSESNQRGIFACSALNRAVDYCNSKYGTEATLDSIKFHATQFYLWLKETKEK